MVSATEDTSMFEQIEEVKCAIEKLPFVTVLSPVRAVKGKGRGYGVTLRCLQQAKSRAEGATPEAF